MKKFTSVNENGITTTIFTEIDKAEFPMIDVEYIYINDTSAYTENDMEISLEELLNGGNYGVDKITEEDIEELHNIIKSWDL